MGKLTEAETEVMRLANGYETCSCESLTWLNWGVAKLWPYCEGMLQNTLKELVEPMLRDVLPGPLKGITFSKVSLGNTLPKLGPIMAMARDHEGFEIQFNIHVAYQGDANIVIDTGIATIGISHISLKGMLSVKLKPIIPEIPIVAGVQLFFINPPKLDLTWTGQLEFANLSVIRDAVMAAINWALVQFVVLPNLMVIQYDFDTLETFDIVRLEDVLPQAVLELTVIEAQRLPAADINILFGSSSDPYAVVELGSQQRKTEVKKRTLNPRWNATMCFLLHSVHQDLTITVKDHDLATKDDLLGKTRNLRALDAIQWVESGTGKWVDLEDASGEIDPIKGPMVHLSARIFELHADGSLPLEKSASTAPASMLVCRVVAGRVPAAIAEPSNCALELALGNNLRVSQDCSEKVKPWTVLTEKVQKAIGQLASQGKSHDEIASMFGENPFLIRRVALMCLGYNLEVMHRPILLLQASDLYRKDGSLQKLQVSLMVKGYRAASGLVDLRPLLDASDRRLQQEIHLEAADASGVTVDLDLELRLFALVEGRPEWVQRLTQAGGVDP